MSIDSLSKYGSTCSFHVRGQGTRLQQTGQSIFHLCERLDGLSVLSFRFSPAHGIWLPQSRPKSISPNLTFSIMASCAISRKELTVTSRGAIISHEAIAVFRAKPEQLLDCRYWKTMIARQRPWSCRPSPLVADAVSSVLSLQAVRSASSSRRSRKSERRRRSSSRCIGSFLWY